jgi:hypothetical protein
MNQGSRSTLITWTVVTSILFVVASIMAIYYYVDASNSRLAAKTMSDRYREVLPEAALNSAEVNEIKNARTATAPQPGITSGMGVFDVVRTQRNNLASAIAGPTATDDVRAMTALDGARTNAAQAIAPAGVTLPENAPVTDLVAMLASAVATKHAELTNAQGALAKSQADLKAAQDAFKAELDARAEAVRAAQGTATDATSNLTNVQTAKDTEIKALQDQLNTALAQAQELQNQNQVTISDLNRRLQNAQKELDVVKGRLVAGRADTASPIMRRGDGRIVRNPGTGIVFIDLGMGDQVSPGLTFEVYDKLEGVPPPGDPANDDSLPQGKASIEIVRVGPSSSEARIITRRPGATINEGDIISNLVYDKNVKYNFIVYGSFDLARSGRATPEEGRRDAETVKRLVTQWGGNIVDEINVDTDFVVLGIEPTIPEFTREELTDPVNKARYDQAVAEVQAYDDVKRKAIDLRIPVLNQNRFLYLVGYYDQAAR